MKELKIILKEIEKTCDEKIDEDIKKQMLIKLWDLYQLKKNEYNNIMNNEIYIIDQNPTKEKVDFSYIKQIVSNIKSSSNKCISREDATELLKWSVQNTRENLSKLGINIETHSLDGYCELSQLLSIYPFEQLGLRVTKNTARYCFDYPYNHAFGTVKIPIIENGKQIEKYFLIDITYRQFFISEKCSKIHYYLNDMIAPSIGYFVQDEQFAKTLMRDGFIELTSATAKKYGEPFTKAGLGDTNIDYFDSIVNCQNDYVLDISQIDGLSVRFPK